MHGRIVMELCEKNWASLTDEEREVFDEWLKGASGEDLYMLLRHGRRMWSRNRPSSTTLEAVKETKSNRPSTRPEKPK